MSEKILRILLTELETMRVKCLSCKTVTELRTDALDPTRPFVHCPHCQELWSAHNSENAFNQLQFAIFRLTRPTNKFQIEFVIRDEG